MRLQEHVRLRLPTLRTGQVHNIAQCFENGYYNLETMLKGFATRGAKISACGTCMDARGMKDEELVDGISRGSMDQLSDWTLRATKVLVF